MKLKNLRMQQREQGGPTHGELPVIDVSGKLRLTAAALDCAGQKELCAAFRRVNPNTTFTLDRSYKWMQGRSLPRSARLYEEWGAVLGLDQPMEWVASCTLGEFADALCTRRGLDRATLLRRSGLSGGAEASLTTADGYLCGAYACYSHAQSPYHRGRIIRGALAIGAAPRRAEGLVATYAQALAVGRVEASGPVLPFGRALSLALTTVSRAVAPVFVQLSHAAPPASVLAGIMSGFTMVDPEGQPPYATRIVAVRVPEAVEALEDSNRYLDPARESLSDDLAALGLRISDAAGLEGRLARILNPGFGQMGSDKVPAADHAALAALCDRNWFAGSGLDETRQPLRHGPRPGSWEPAGVAVRVPGERESDKDRGPN